MEPTSDEMEKKIEVRQNGKTYISHSHTFLLDNSSHFGRTRQTADTIRGNLQFCTFYRIESAQYWHNFPVKINCSR